MEWNNKCIIAITGPSGAGKTTLGDNLSNKNQIAIPRHCTTRLRRNDDREGFYRYLEHDTYRRLLEQQKFLISSGDGPIVSKEYGNFYGVLKGDCLHAWKESNVIILFVSYKDIYQILSLQEKGLNIQIINLTFNNIEEGISSRLRNDIQRNHTEQDIKNRINSALSDKEEYGKLLELYSKAIIYTDVLNEEQTYQKACKVLNLKK